MKKIMFLTFVAAFALALAGCETTRETNSNKAVVLDTANTNVVNTTTVNTAANDRVVYDREITRADYDRDKDKYTTDAERGGATIGQGAEDGWLWTKTKSALATTNDLRDSTINVDVENSVVTLRGTVASKAGMEKAIKVSQEIEGVKKVNNMLKVSASDSMTNQTVTDDPARPNVNMKK